MEEGLDFGFDQMGSGTDGNGIVEDVEVDVDVLWSKATTYRWQTGHAAQLSHMATTTPRM